MLTKKFYIPIGVCVLLVLAIGFLSLRSDVPDDPIVIYKPTTTEAETPAKVTEAAEKETATGGPFHADGTPLQAEPHSDNTSKQAEASNNAVPWEIAKLQLTPEKRREIEERNADFLARHEAWQAERAQKIAQSDKYRAEVIQHIDNMQAYHRKEQALNEEWKKLSADDDVLAKEAEDAIRTGNREQAFKIRDAMLDLTQRWDKLEKRLDALRAEKPIRPTPPPSIERSNNE